MIKQKTLLEIAKDKRTYTLHCEPDSPLGEIYDVLIQMKGFVVDRIMAEEAKNKTEPEAQVE